MSSYSNHGDSCPCPDILGLICGIRLEMGLCDERRKLSHIVGLTMAVLVLVVVLIVVLILVASPAADDELKNDSRAWYTVERFIFNGMLVASLFELRNPPRVCFWHTGLRLGSDYLCLVVSHSWLLLRRCTSAVIDVTKHFSEIWYTRCCLKRAWQL